MTTSITPKRKLVLEALKQEGLVSARELSAKCPDVDQATVYRTLDLFVQDGLVKRYHLDSPEALYECQEKAHHHAVCSSCSKIIHLDLPEEKILSLFPTQSSFKPSGMDITIYGQCGKCRIT